MSWTTPCSSSPPGSPTGGSRRSATSTIDAMVRRLDHALAAAGRSPADLRRVINVSGTVTDGASKGHFDGPVGQWVDDIGELAVSYGFDTFGFWGEGDRQLARFAEEVVPAVRDQLTVG